ncbi:phage FluMu protein Com [Anaerosolibacter carboniphilus]|uniref:Phage FluMu protein Com n=1 Tax=Anaerosolibacter carboniphilus TaxID=1417629 RepID=A0A841L1C8_9FIRM|nr:phage FluMu protein Com [Anaerosolibacter carboniphilus]
MIFNKLEVIIEEIRCINCERLLGKVLREIRKEIEIKCTECKTTHKYILEALEAQTT